MTWATSATEGQRSAWCCQSKLGLDVRCLHMRSFLLGFKAAVSSRALSMRVAPYLPWMFIASVVGISSLAVPVIGVAQANVPSQDWVLRPTLTDPRSDFLLDGGVTKMVRWNDGSGETLYVVGDLRWVGGRPAGDFARWDGSRWVPLPVNSSELYPGNFFSDLVVYQDRLLGAGRIRVSEETVLNGVLEWNGSAWQPFEGAAREHQFASDFSLSVDGDMLLVRGDVEYVVPGISGDLALWNGAAWIQIPSPPSRGGAALYQGRVHAIGHFGSGAEAAYVARWSGSSWDILPDGPSAKPEDGLEVAGGLLIAAGDTFGMPDDPTASMAAWNGTSWTSLTGAPLKSQEAVAGYAGGLIATRRTGILFGSETPTFWIGFWDGSDWSDFPAPGAAAASSILVDGERMLFGGWDSRFLFDDARTGAPRVLSWSPGGGLMRFARAAGHFSEVVAYKEGLLFAGWAEGLGWDRVGCVAFWSGSAWSGLGEGIPDCGKHGTNVVSVAVHGDQVVAAAGDASGGFPERVWIWNGEQWIDSGLETTAMGRVDVSVAGGIFWAVGNDSVFRFENDEWHATSLGEWSVGATRRILELDGVPHLVADDVLLRWTGAAWEAAITAPSDGMLLDAIVDRGTLIALTRSSTNPSSNLWVWEANEWHHRHSVPGIEYWLASTAMGAVVFGRQSWLVQDQGLRSLSECGNPFAVYAWGAASLGNEFFLLGHFGYHPTVCVLGPAHDSSLVLRARSVEGNPRSIVVRATVSSASAPLRGVIGVDGVPAGSCTIEVIQPLDESRAMGECRIDLDRDMEVLLQGTYFGGGISQGDAWLESRSPTLRVDIGSFLFFDSFE